MVFRENKYLHTPSDTKAKVWRYMDFAKFLMFLDRQALFFIGLEQLKLSDPYEGYFLNSNPIISSKDTDQKFTHEQMNELVLSSHQFTFVNCWHVNPFESAAMWKIYCGNGDGVAILSTFERLKNSFVVNEFTPPRKDNKNFQMEIGEI